jgi:hypothetical protein
VRAPVIYLARTARQPGWYAADARLVRGRCAAGTRLMRGWYAADARLVRG